MIFENRAPGTVTIENSKSDVESSVAHKNCVFFGFKGLSQGSAFSSLPYSFFISVADRVLPV
jgi:hypothetical protein